MQYGCVKMYRSRQNVQIKGVGKQVHLKYKSNILKMLIAKCDSLIV